MAVTMRSKELPATRNDDEKDNNNNNDDESDNDFEKKHTHTHIHLVHKKRGAISDYVYRVAYL